MSESRPSQNTALPSAQYPGTGLTPLLAATTGQAPAVDNNQIFLQPGTHDAGDEDTTMTNGFSEHDSSLEQTGLAGSSPPSQTVHGKVACQACVSRTVICYTDI